MGMTVITHPLIPSRVKRGREEREGTTRARVSPAPISFKRAEQIQS
jgi:hypothetical protein